MPILNIEIVGRSQEFPSDLAQQLADAAGVALNSRPQGTWIKITFVDPKQYAENGGVSVGVHPVIVSLIQSEVLDATTLKQQTSELTDAISAASGVPSNNVHIINEPSAKGRVSFGGNLVE